MGEGEEGSCLVGDEKGKNTTGLRGETGEGEASFVGEDNGDAASLVGEEKGARLVGERGAGLVGDDVEELETGVEGVLQVKTAGGSEGEGVLRGEQGAAVVEGEVFISGAEATGKDSADGEVEI